MTHFAIIDQSGNVVSVGTVVADPLPQGLTAHQLSDADAAALAAGGSWVDGAVVPAPSPVDGAALIAAARADVQAATTIAQLRTRTLELDRLRTLYPNT